MSDLLKRSLSESCGELVFSARIESFATADDFIDI
jgi:hypothetical protein